MRGGAEATGIALRRQLTRAARFADDSSAVPRRPLGHDRSLSRRARDPFVLPASLTVSIVTFRPDRALLERCLERLAAAIVAACEAKAIASVNVALIDNSEDRAIAVHGLR